MENGTLEDLLLLRAYREAARAVAACRLLIPFEFASIEPGIGILEEMGGWDRAVGFAGCREPANSTPVRFERQPESYIVTHLAGIAIDRQLSEQFWEEQDLLPALQMARCCCDSTERAATLVRFLWDRTETLLRVPENRRAVEVLARELLTYRTLDAGDVYRILDGSGDGHRK